MMIFTKRLANSSLAGRGDLFAHAFDIRYSLFDIRYLFLFPLSCLQNCFSQSSFDLPACASLLQARNYLARLPLKIKSVIVDNLHKLAANPDNPSLDIDVLKGKKGFRLRVGQYRIVYTRQDDRLIIEIVKIRPRGDIYKG